MVYANSHIGYCYWPTKSGQMHRGLRGRDVVRRDHRALPQGGHRRRRLLQPDLQQLGVRADPEWRILYNGGTPSRDIPPLGRYGVVCPNNAGYREFVEAQVEEICTGYEFDGIFFDMTFWPGVCFCAACRERYAREVGGEMPTIINWQDPQWVAFQKKREEWLVEFAAFATGTAKKYRPGISVEHNSAPLTQPWFLGTTIGLRDQNDYIGGDLYGGFGEQSFVCKLYHSITPNQPFEFMTSRCYPNLRDHTTMKSKEMLEVHAYLAMAHNGAFFFIDAIDPDGHAEPEGLRDDGGDIRPLARTTSRTWAESCARTSRSTSASTRRWTSRTTASPPISAAARSPISTPPSAPRGRCGRCTFPSASSAGTT